MIPYTNWYFLVANNRDSTQTGLNLFLFQHSFTMASFYEDSPSTWKQRWLLNTPGLRNFRRGCLLPSSARKNSKRRNYFGPEPINKPISQAKGMDTLASLSHRPFPGTVGEISSMSYTWKKGVFERKRGLFIQGKGRRMVAGFIS